MHGHGDRGHVGTRDASSADMTRMKWLLPLACYGLAVAARRAVRQVRQESLDGRVALITGGSRGLGLEIARELARQGCSIVLAARDATELDRARQDVQSIGAQVLTIPCDVSDRTQVRALLTAALERFSRVDILVNNAGIIVVGPLETQRIQDFEQAMAVMYWGMVYATLEVLPHMRARHAGHIVNITSVGGKVSV